MLGTTGVAEFAQLIATHPCQVTLQEDPHEFFAADGYVPVSPFEKRRSIRKYFRCRAVLEITQTIPALPRRNRWGGILMRDMSQFGAGFLYHEQLYPEEVVRVWLPGRCLEGRVAYAHYRGPMCYEIGMALQHIHRVQSTGRTYHA